jgi:hypothetical protein
MAIAGVKETRAIAAHIYCLTADRKYGNMAGMKKFASFCLMIALCSAGMARDAGDWLANFEDVPQMDGIYVIADDGFVYSRPDGKIIQTTVSSDVVSRRQFQRFYRDALYELGWNEIRDERKLQTFRRGRDELNIEILETDPLSARFTMTPVE